MTTLISCPACGKIKKERLLSAPQGLAGITDKVRAELLAQPVERFCICKVTELLPF